jgi:hypothetical protein
MNCSDFYFVFFIDKQVIMSALLIGIFAILLFVVIVVVIFLLLWKFGIFGSKDEDNAPPSIPTNFKGIYIAQS